MSEENPELSSLIKRLEELEPPSKDRSEIESIELQIMELLGGSPEGAEQRKNLRLNCHLKVKIHSKDAVHMGTVTNIGNGGVFVQTELFPVGVQVQIEVRGNNPASKLKLRGNVAWVQDGEDAGIGIAFGDISIAKRERRLRSFVRLLLSNIS